ncbi:MAG: PTS sugar transporter subunit IIB [Mycoplasmoidaceae bacterium]
MIKILLACSAGMSTSLLEESMIKYAASINVKTDIVAKASGEAKGYVDEYDIVMLGPQVRFMEQNFKDLAKGKPVVVIPPQIYAMAKGKECFELALEHLKK